MTTVLVILPWVLLLVMTVRLRVSIASERAMQHEYYRVLGIAFRLVDDLMKDEERINDF